MAVTQSEMVANSWTDGLVEEGEAFRQFARLPAVARPAEQHFDVIVVGGGQAGLSVGHHLAKRGLRFVILDAGERIGDNWRKRWDSLRLFTPARYDSLDGLRFPGPPDYFPTKDEMADYLETYAAHFRLPVRCATSVRKLWRRDGRFVVQAGGSELTADQVVVAMANYQRGSVPRFARALDPEIVQLHSCDYRNPAQLRPGDVLIVGAGNSGADIAMELSPAHRIWMAGRETGHVPFRIEGFWGRHLLVRLVLRFLFHRILSLKTWIGRQLRPRMLHGGGPLIRIKPHELAAAGVARTPRVAGVSGGLPLLEDGRVLEVANVLWCTGYHPAFSWIELPIFDPEGEVSHEAGVVTSVPGLYFVGLHFLYSFSSTMIHGVGRDAARIVERVASRARQTAPGPRAWTSLA
jgi:putative flavoprotein involved in K+ transport